ncbi:carbohydrate ABC transporter permease [Paenibacillus bouchesdurhonensis]|uniref:carbohydrate ABC transporter permease n=1 Tax=Paenibacillus bouchesdurhonensis TaxID=1870990 RepID=UPI000DA5EEFE|nr:sugar ABC transporter permease [Paenibacillus bouchesdurhonensis]
MELNKRNLLISLAYVVPALIFMLVLIGYPLFYNIKISFQHLDLMTLNNPDIAFAGLDNYRKVIGLDSFHIAFKNTFFFTFWSIFLQFTIGFALALFFNMKFRLAGFLRGLTLVSYLVPIVITALLFKFMFNQSVGIINYALLSIGFVDQPIEWLTHPELAMWSVIIANVWVGAPFNMMLLSTGLSSLPDDIYEAASIDGANKFKQFVYMTLPMLRPVIMVVIMMGFIFTFKVFDLIFVMTAGGPVNATEVLSTLAYKLSFDQFNFSQGAAASNILFFILFIVSLIYLRMVRSDEVM